ncbi:M3 family oligoendopeptidase [Elusimicrobiota bacterium]
MNSKWNLNHIVTLKEFDNLFKKTENNLKTFSKYFNGMQPDMSKKSFRSIILFSESLKRDISRLGYRAYLWEAAEQKSQKARMLKDKVRDLEVRADDQARKIWHWIKGKKVKGKKTLDKKNAARLFSSVPDLEYVLGRKRKLAAHTLSQPEESIISNKDNTGINVLTDLRTLIETEFEYDFKPRGFKKAKKIKTQSELGVNIYSDKSERREAAYRALLNKYRENIDKFFLIYSAVVKDWVYETKLRGYNSPISIRNTYNDIPDKAVKTLLHVCAENVNIYRDYFCSKAGHLKIKKLRRYDIYAPISRRKKKTPYNQALDIVMGSLREFSPGFYKKAGEMIRSGHLHSHPHPEKQGGAFCATAAPDIKPYILMNYTGSHRDILTLAHELGHGIHSLYAAGHSISSQSANLPLSETASTLCEMIVFEKLLKETKSARERRFMLADKLSDSYATVIRQNYFVKFEIEAHSRINDGLTAEGLSGIYFKNLKEQFGSSVDIDPMFRYEWAYIPHIVNSPFYCYAYNFGELLSLALYSRYRREGKGFIPEIEKILSYGGSKDPVRALKEIGIDINSSGFWQGGFNIISGWQDEFKKI